MCCVLCVRCVCCVVYFVCVECVVFVCVVCVYVRFHTLVALIIGDVITTLIRRDSVPLSSFLGKTHGQCTQHVHTTSDTHTIDTHKSAHTIDTHTIDTHKRDTHSDIHGHTTNIDTCTHKYAHIQHTRANMHTCTQNAQVTGDTDRPPARKP